MKKLIASIVCLLRKLVLKKEFILLIQIWIKNLQM